MPLYDEENPGADYNRQQSLRLCIPSARPERSTVIQEDEILDLVIALNTTNSVYDFLVNFDG